MADDQTHKTARAAFEESVALMRATYAEMPAATFDDDRHSRALTADLTEIFMLRLGDVIDADGNVDAFAQGATHAIGNLLATLGSCFANGDPDLTAYRVEMLLMAITGRARRRVNDPTRGAVIFGPGGSVIQRGK